MYQEPKADFLLRFENTGNTHLRPEGDITIYNMWGRERGKVLINQADAGFGNVLPQSVRRFEFSWTGDQDPFDIGLYSAVVTLAYGDSNKQNVTGTTYFWVIPVVPVAIGLTSILLFLLSIVWFIRRYIRRALELEQMRYGVRPAVAPLAKAATPAPVSAPSIVETLIEPVREGVIDLRRVASAAPATQAASKSSTISFAEQQTRSVGQLLRKYRLFLLFVLVCIFGGIGAWVYLHTVLEGKRGFQITDVHIQAEAAPRP